MLHFVSCLLVRDIGPSELRGAAPQLVMFFVPQSQQCQAYQERFAALEEKVGGVIFSRLNCSDYKAFCQEHGKHALPELQLFADGEEFTFFGERDDDAIQQWIRRRVSPLFAYNVTAEGLQRMAAENKQVSYFTVEGPLASAQALEESLKRLRGMGVMGFVQDESAEKPLLKAQRQNATVLFTGSLRNPAQVEQFLQLHSLPLCPLVTPEILTLFETSGLSSVLLFAHESDGPAVDSFQQLVRTRFQELHGAFAFGILRAKDYQKLEEDGGLPPDAPTVLLFGDGAVFRGDASETEDMIRVFQTGEREKLRRLELKPLEPRESVRAEVVGETVPETRAIEETERTRYGRYLNAGVAAALVVCAAAWVCRLVVRRLK